MFKFRQLSILALLCAVAQGAWATDYNVSNEAELSGAIEDNANITLTRDIDISKAITVGNGQTVTIDLGGFTLNRGCTSRGSQVIGVYSGGTLYLSNGTVTGGWGGGGGAMFNEGTMHLTNVIIDGNTADDRGGGLSNNGTLTMTGCTVKNNTSRDAVNPAGGGGIFNYSGKTATLTNCTITSNTASTYGGGGICNYGTMTLENCSVKNNNADTTGGGIFNSTSGTLSINGCDITGNSAVSYGDGIYIDNSTINMQGLCKVTGNTDSNIYLYGSGTVITVTGAFTSGSSIGVGVTDYGRKLTSGYSTYNSGHDPSEFFSMDNYMYGIGEKDGEAYPGISYVERSWVWNDENDESKGGHVAEETKVCIDYTDYDGRKDVNTGWYLLSGSHTYEDRIACHGDVKFILVDGSYTVFENGIHIDNPKYLTIYGQRDDTGQIKVYGNGVDDNAGIGGNDGYMGGYLTIHGGYIWARTGGNNGAAIGGGEGHNSGMQSITIYGGTIDAKGQSSGAGIGCGEHNDNLPDVTIYGGTVTAIGGNYAAGIGGSEDCGNGTIKIYGGTVTATGGKNAAGIGSGEEASMNNPIEIYGGTVTATGGFSGAGIGSGSEADMNKPVKIYGGTVYASGCDYGAGIGSGYSGSNNSTIEIHGGNVYATGGDYGAGIGGGEPGSDAGAAAREFHFDSDDDDNGGGNVVRSASRRSSGKIYGGKGGKIYIHDGYVYAKGGYYAAGIGDGYNRTGSSYAYIYGGTIKVEVYNNDGGGTNQYIGSGYNPDTSSTLPIGDNVSRSFDFPDFDDEGGSDETAPRHAPRRTYEYSRLKLADNMSVSYGSTKVSASKRGETCMGSPSDDSIILTVEPCDHSDCSYSIKNDSQHKLNCSYCSAGSTENHNTDGENGSCSLCGYGDGEYTLSFYEANATANGYGDATEYTMGKGVTFKLPECSNVPDKMVFAGWKKVTSSETAPDGIEASNDELSSLKAAGSSITISADMDGDRYYARYQTCWEGDGTGALDNPFLVQTKDDWDYIASKVNNSKITYSGKYFKMTDNIGTTESPVYNFIGTSSTKFAGNFNGGRKTLTVIYSFVHDYCAPFRYVNGAAIMNLRVDGTLTTSAKHAGGVIGYAEGTNTINNCRVHATVNNTKGSDGSTGGFVGYNNGTVNFTRCIFDGKLSGSSTPGWGGFVGWNAGGAKVNFTNCLFKPDANSDVTDGCTFARCQTASDMTITNSYYTQSFGTAQGTQAYTVESYDTDKMWLYYGQLETDEEDEAIAALEYRENEIFAFDTGLLYQKIFYTGGETAVTFTPIATMEGQHVSGVSASTGTPTENGDGSYTLTMENNNVTITATGFSNYESLTLYDASANTATLEENEDKIMNVTISGRKLYKDGDWNTLCLPFDVSAEKISANSDLSGATIMELDTEGWYDSEGNRYDEEAEGRHQTSFASDGTLYLYFLATTSIDAGVPCLVKWTTTGDPITSPTFYSSYIESSSPGTVESADGKVSFIGNFDPVTLTGGDKSVLYLGADNQLYYPAEDHDRTINAFRAYFTVDLSDAPAGVRTFVLNFGEEDTTGVALIDNGQWIMDNSAEANSSLFTLHSSLPGWYDLQGRRVECSMFNVQRSMLKKGVYIVNGKKVVIK